MIDTPAGRLPVSAIATVEETDGPNMIGRENGRRRIVVYANTDGSDMGRVVGEIRSGALAIRRGQVTFVPVCNPLAYAKGERTGRRSYQSDLLCSTQCCRPVVETRRPCPCGCAASSLTPTSLKLIDSATGQPISASVSYSPLARAAVIDPVAPLGDGTYTLEVAPSVADAAVLVVAQRVSTIRDADQILVLEDGEIIGRGRHDELLESCPTYAEIVESQIGQGAVA